jgi:D-alanine transaminase
MTRIAYVNGHYVQQRDAGVHIEDRGYQFADGVYEVCEIRQGKMVDMRGHLTRLARSLSELRIRPPMSDAALKIVLRETVRRNKVSNGMVYMQVTRGVARRDHAFPADDISPSLVVTAKPMLPSASDAAAAKGIKVITVPDNRWERVDIKTIGLLPNVLAKQAAREAGAKEAWFVDADGFVTEGSSTNAWIVTVAGEIVTRPATSGILRGITRTTLLEVARKAGLRVVERAFTVEEAQDAAEAFITAATTIVMPVIQINDAVVGSGKPGTVSKQLRNLFHAIAEVS